MVLFSGIVILLLLSGVFSASETALMSLSRTELKRMGGGEPSEKLVCRLLKNSHRLLSTILVGNMFVNVLLAALFSTFLDRCLHPGGGIGVFERLAYVIDPDAGTVFTHRFSQACGMLLNVLVVTPLLMIFGEQTPKMIAYSNGVAISRKVSAFLSCLCVLFAPINGVLHFLANVILRICGQGGIEQEHEMTADELLSSISVGKETGATDGNEHVMLERLVSLGTIVLREVMTHRVEIVGIRDSMTLHDAFQVARSRRHSWYPVYHRDCDDIWGMLSLMDILKWRGRPEMKMTIAQFREKLEGGLLVDSPVTAPVFVPDTSRIDKVLNDMRQAAIGVVIAVDEYGGTSGIATQDDLIEELVGRFASDDADVDALHLRHDGTYVCDGRAHLRVLEKTLGEDCFGEEDDSDTIGGLVMERTESIPKAGATVELDDGTKIIVKRMAGRRVKQVVIVPGGEKQ